MKINLHSYFQLAPLLVVVALTTADYVTVDSEVVVVVHDVAVIVVAALLVFL